MHARKGFRESTAKQQDGYLPSLPNIPLGIVYGFHLAKAKDSAKEFLSEFIVRILSLFSGSKAAL